jgi:L-threonylcarbamoyladenylate synthase
MPQVSLSQMVQSLTISTPDSPVLVSFPTDTVPALAARPDQAHIIYEAKKRPPEKPLILMGASLDSLLPYVTGNAEAIAQWQSLTSQHWPGPLTLVLPASDRTPASLNPQATGTLGIRVPNHPIALALLSQTGPLATTSANFSGQPSLTEPDAIAQAFPNALVLSTDQPASQPASSGTPSTVVQWTGQDWQILRQGEIKL